LPGSNTDLTVLLDDWVRGKAGALEHLLPHVYPELHALARASLRRGARPVTLQTTAVVNDLFVKLLTSRPKRIENRRHFYVLAARVIRMSLVDHYRETMAERRGGQRQRVPLNDELAWVDADSEDMIALDHALEELERLDPEQAELFNARFLLGCTAEETAELTGLSKATVDRRVRLARAWLFRKLRGDRPEPPGPAVSEPS
jgi:RNA polymerase sigma factor (TIGR02999 family)